MLAWFILEIMVDNENVFSFGANQRRIYYQVMERSLSKAVPPLKACTEILPPPLNLLALKFMPLLFAPPPHPQIMTAPLSQHFSRNAW